MPRWFRLLEWPVLFLLIVAAMYEIGYIVGAALYMWPGSLLVHDMTLHELAAKGAHDGGFLLGAVWGPGTSFVICCIVGHHRIKRRRRERAAAEARSSGQDTVTAGVH